MCAQALVVQFDLLGTGENYRLGMMKDGRSSLDDVWKPTMVSQMRAM